MKNIYTLLFLLIVSLTSCNDFLDEDSRSESDSDSYFSNRAEGFASVNILYKKGFADFFGGGAFTGPHVMDGGYYSGLYTSEYTGQSDFLQNCQTLALDPIVNNGDLEDMWKKPYESIVRYANYAIQGLPNCPGLTDKERSQLLAEAKFFRALNYFFLVKTFGEIPIITKYYKAVDDIYIRKSTVDKVYALITTDLEEALTDGKLENKPQSTNGARISEGTVRALLADVYLTMAGYPLNDASKYAKAAEQASMIVNSGIYPLIEHANASTSAYNILKASDKQSEYLYSVEFDASLANNGNRAAWGLPLGSAAWWGGAKISITNKIFDPNAILHAAYDADNDLRYQEGQYFFTKLTHNGLEKDLGGKTSFFWFDEEVVFNTGQGGKDWTWYRTAEMYLIAAEAIAQTRTIAEAAPYLAKVQARASMNKTESEIIAELTAKSKDQFLQEVWAEKVRELIFECKLWGDIRRLQMYPAVQGGVFKFIPIGAGVQTPFDKTLTPAKMTFPICFQETQRNPALSEPAI